MGKRIYVGPLQAGIQNVATAFISLDGPELDKIPVNSELSFNWDWDGFGKQYCFFDGLMYYNAEEFTCKQPLGFTLPDSKNHTLTVMLQVSRHQTPLVAQRVVVD